MLLSLLLIFSCLEVHSGNRDNPEEWIMAVVELTDGTTMRGKVFLDSEVVSNYERHISPDSYRTVEKRGRKTRGERLFFYHDNLVSFYLPQQVASIILLDGEQKPKRQFVTLPYRYHKEDGEYYFFEVLVEGQLSLLKRYFTINGFGQVEVMYLLDESFTLQPCPTRKKEVLELMGLGAREVRKKTWFKIMSGLDEEEVGNMVRIYNEQAFDANMKAKK